MILCVSIITLFLALRAGILLNVTESYPRGIYIKKAVAEKKGDLIVFCPNIENEVVQIAKNENIFPPSNTCPGQLPPMLKRIVGVPKDQIKITTNGIKVNGSLIKNSKIKYPYFQKNVFVGDNFTLKKNEYWVMSEYSPNSLDSRYMGPIQKKQIKYIVKPYFLIE